MAFVGVGVMDSPIQISNLNILESFHYFRDWQSALIKQANSFILDSGAFSFLKSPVKRDWNSYVDKYADFIIANDIKLFVELDIDTVIGKAETVKLRDRLIKRTNRLPIWVLQAGRSFDEFINATQEYPYVALSLSGKTGLSKQRRNNPNAVKHLCDIAHSNNALIHGLGFTDPNINKYNFDSVDSTAWLYGGRCGFLWHYDGATLIKHFRPENHRINSIRTLQYHNLCAWINYIPTLRTKVYLAGLNPFHYFFKHNELN